jgi:hypothetical protein
MEKLKAQMKKTKWCQQRITNTKPNFLGWAFGVEGRCVMLKIKHAEEIM